MVDWTGLVNRRVTPPREGSNPSDGSIQLHERDMEVLHEEDEDEDDRWNIPPPPIRKRGDFPKMRDEDTWSPRKVAKIGVGEDRERVTRAKRQHLDREA